jgi:predicted small lipoprotein YifL
MNGRTGGVAFLIRFCDRSALRLAAFVALAAALALGGCGRKGPLDPPPSAAIAPALDQPSLGDNPDPNMTGYRRAPSSTVMAQPTVPSPSDRRTFILDPLIK